MASAFDLAGIARSLLCIEANTIVRDNMTAEPMPPLPHALLDIAADYTRVLLGQGVDLHSYLAVPIDQAAATAPARVPNPDEISDLLTVSKDTFLRLRWAAKHAGDPAVPMAAVERILFDRIINNCDAVKEIFTRLGDPMKPFVGLNREQLTQRQVTHAADAIDVDDLIAVQKMWDIGVEVIVAQTIVRVTGDVTTRVQHALTQPGSEAVFAIHRQAVDTSISCWRDVVRVVSDIAGAALGTLLGRPR